MNPAGDILQLLEGDWQAFVDTMTERDTTAESILEWSRTLGRRMTPPVLYAELEDLSLSWRELLDPDWVAVYETRYITAEWKVQALVAHVASWASEIHSQAQTIVQGQTFDYTIPFALSVIGPKEWNHKKVEERREKTMVELMDEIEGATTAMQDIVLSTAEQDLYRPVEFPMTPSGDPQSRWKGNLASLVVLRCSHDRWHMERIRQFKETIARMQP
jgi:hypothetical protein